MPETEICFLTATEMARCIRAKELSATEVMEAHLTLRARFIRTPREPSGQNKRYLNLEYRRGPETHRASDRTCRTQTDRAVSPR
jgi:Asp-tRNA(Asn)/Glu-tRNA(Gln) amidotransferase A subunit family amidase